MLAQVKSRLEQAALPGGLELEVLSRQVAYGRLDELKLGDAILAVAPGGARVQRCYVPTVRCQATVWS